MIYSEKSGFMKNAEQIKCNLINAIEKQDSHVVISICMNRQMIGLFSFLALKDEQYLEMLVGLSHYEEAYSTMFAYLKEHFIGYSADFVFNPNNYLLCNCLKQNGAELVIHLYESMGFEKIDNQNSVAAHLQM